MKLAKNQAIHYRLESAFLLNCNINNNNITTFIQKGHIKLVKSKNRDILMLQVIFISIKCCSCGLLTYLLIKESQVVWIAHM